MDVCFFVPGNIESAYIIGAADENGARITSSNYGSTVDFNVVADSTSEAAAKFSGYYTLNGAVADEKLVFPTDYVKEEKIDYNGPIIKHQISFYNYQGSRDDLVWISEKLMKTEIDDEYITARIGFAEDAQAVSDYSSMIERFEKKVHDLELTRMVALQMAPQIRMVQSNDTVMAEKIQSTIVNTIPLWKNQMVIAMGENHSAQAAKAQKEVTDMTNQLLLSNAQKLKQTTVDIRRESERGIVDIETLRQTNGILIDTMNEILKIQQEGREQRRQAQAQLAQMEQQMKEKLLEISK